MPLDLTDAELAIAATACRAMAYQEGERIRRLQPPVRGVSRTASALREELVLALQPRERSVQLCQLLLHVA
jgi:hypothetical protein